ncbi:MAG TPA: sensor histidine kinase [Gemmatimonas aurantiaca]|nr:sensor histidine kinase [Gemmatimonas aurantiaca]
MRETPLRPRMALRPDAHLPRIRLRFTALYATTLLVVLLSAATALRFALRATLEREFSESVAASAGFVQQFFRTEIHELRTIEGTIVHVTEELVFEDRAIRVRRPDGSMVGDSAKLARRAQDLPVGPVRVMRVPLDPPLAPGYYVEVRASLSNMLALQQQVDRWFLIGIPFLVLCAAGAGWWLTGRTLRPVGAMADAAARIAPASGIRLPVDDPRDEIGRLGLRFNALLDRLDGALSQQREFLADAAHELRTPIARMRARVELAMLGVSVQGPDGADVTGEVARGDVLIALDGELRAVSHQVDELLQLARADAMGDEAPVLRRLFLDDLVADELPRWRPQAVKLGLSLDFVVLEETPVLGDPVLLSRLVGVLVDNALRYGHEGGDVRLSVRPDNGVARFEVEDNGIGIPASDRARIFDRFYRGEDARHKRADGSGLGLAIAMWIVRRHGGRIDVAEGTAGGSVFVVRLPLAQG